jgi:DNA-directed RNA polymerase specialized sigma24 family protein
MTDARGEWIAEEFQQWMDGNMSSNADRKRWVLWAARLLKGLPVEPEELLREAVMRVLAGQRTLSRQVPIDVNVFGIMRSIASSWHKRRARRPEISVEDLIGSDDEGQTQDPFEVLAVPEDAQAASPEQELAFKQEMDAISNLFADREDAQLVIMGRAEGLKGAALAEAAGLDQARLASVQRLIARRLAGYRRDA